MVKSQPRLLYYRGQFLDDALRAERVAQSEVAAAIRQRGSGSLNEVAAVVLETSGEFAIITAAGDGSLLP